MPNPRPAIVLLVLFLATSIAGAQDADPEKTFDALFGSEVKKARATAETADDLALAQTLADVMRNDDQPAALRAVVGVHVATLACVSPEGQALADEALAVLKTVSPEKHLDALGAVVEARNRAYTRSRGDEKKDAGERLIIALLERARASERIGLTAPAMTHYRRALSIATALRSEQKEPIRQMIKDAAETAAIRRKLDALKAKIKADPKDGASAQELVRLYIVELDDPASARKYTFLLSDETWKVNVSQAAKDVDALEADDALRLGDWYHGHAKTAVAPVRRVPLLRRAVAFYGRYQAAGGEGLNAVRAKLTAKQIEAEIEEIGLPAENDSPGGKWVDLLDGVRYPRSLFKRDGSELIGGGRGSGTFSFTARPKGDYEMRWKLRFTRAEPSRSSIAVHLPVGKTSTHWWTWLVTKSEPKGLNRIGAFTFIEKHRAIKDANPTGVNGKLVLNKDYEFKVRVRTKGDQAQIELALNGRTVSRWSGPLSAVEPRRGSVVSAPTMMTYQSEVVIKSPQIRMLNGELEKIESD